MSMEIEHRVTEIEHVLTRLATIQEQQTKQNDKIINSVDKFKLIAALVEQNTQDINRINERMLTLQEKYYQDKDIMEENISTTAERTDTKITTLFWKGVGTLTTVMIFIFGYVYKDMETNRADIRQVIVSNTRLKSDCTHINHDIDKLAKKLNIKIDQFNDRNLKR